MEGWMRALFAAEASRLHAARRGGSGAHREDVGFECFHLMTL